MAELTVKNIVPLSGYVLVEQVEAQKQTASGIYLPNAGEEKPQMGTVVSVGDATYVDGREVKSPVKKGDSVIYKKWGGNEIKLKDGKEVQIMKFEDIIALVTTK